MIYFIGFFWIYINVLVHNMAPQVNYNNTWFVSRIITLKKYFPRTFFDVTSMVEKPSTLFPRTFFDVTSMVEKPTLYPRTFLM